MSIPPIADYGVIGNCHTAALVSSHGSLDWLCLPRFDSPSLFARILDTERGGFWSIQPADAQATHRYLPNTNVLETAFTCAQGRVRVLDCMDVTLGNADAAEPVPGGLIRIIEGIAGEVVVDVVCAPRPDYARSLPSFALHGKTIVFGRFTLRGPVAWACDQARHTLTCRVRVRAGQRLAFTLLVDAQADQSVMPERALETTIAFWERWAARCTYAGPYRAAVIRSALALKLMTDAPTGAIIAAPTTSLPETIGGERNWDYRFTWLRDSSFTLYALLLAGYLDADDPFFRWIVETVKLEGTGIHILYPISPDGQIAEQTLAHLSGYRDSRPVRIGNGAADQVQLDIYGEVLNALYFAWQVGQYDPAPVWQHFCPLADWVAKNWHLPESGLWEVRGGVRHFVYGKVMCWVALDRAIKLAEANKLAGDIAHWRVERDRIRTDVFAHGWSEKLGAWKQSYQDETLDAANLLLPTVGFIAGDDPRMQSTINATLEKLVVNGLCYRYLDAPEGVSGKEATFVLCTFWLVDALIQADRAEEAQTIFEQILARATPLGLFAEELDHVTGEHLGNFPQAFSHIGVISAAVSLAHVGQAGAVPSAQADAAGQARLGGVGMRGEPRAE